MKSHFRVRSGLRGTGIEVATYFGKGWPWPVFLEDPVAQGGRCGLPTLCSQEDGVAGEGRAEGRSSRRSGWEAVVPGVPSLQRDRRGLVLRGGVRLREGRHQGGKSGEVVC